jgi:hypothetical protein
MTVAASSLQITDQRVAALASESSSIRAQYASSRYSGRRRDSPSSNFEGKRIAGRRKLMLIKPAVAANRHKIGDLESNGYSLGPPINGREFILWV